VRHNLSSYLGGGGGNNKNCMLDMLNINTGPNRGCGWICSKASNGAGKKGEGEGGGEED